VLEARDLLRGVRDNPMARARLTTDRVANADAAAAETDESARYVGASVRVLVNAAAAAEQVAPTGPVLAPITVSSVGDAQRREIRQMVRETLEDAVPKPVHEKAPHTDEPPRTVKAFGGEVDPLIKMAMQGTPSPEAAPEAQEGRDTPLSVKGVLWRAMHRVTMANVPWADDFSALVSAMAALLRVQAAPVTTPMEQLGTIHPVHLLEDAIVMVETAAKFGAELTPWPALYTSTAAAAIELLKR